MKTVETISSTEVLEHMGEISGRGDLGGAADRIVDLMHEALARPH